jgi:hypothetical protein
VIDLKLLEAVGDSQGAEELRASLAEQERIHARELGEWKRAIDRATDVLAGKARPKMARTVNQNISFHLNILSTRRFSWKSRSVTKNCQDERALAGRGAMRKKFVAWSGREGTARFFEGKWKRLLRQSCDSPTCM